MKRLPIVAIALLLLAGCNLSDRQPNAPTPLPSQTAPATSIIPTLPPPSNPTRTPIGANSAPPTFAAFASAPPGYAPVGVRTQPPSSDGTSGTTNGPAASITAPGNGATVASGIIQITGTAGGIFENQFTLALILPDGSVINSQTITLTTSDPSFIVPWAAALGTNGFTGAIEIRAYTASPRDGSIIILASVQVVVQ